jgi:Tfp pilus assembly protein PilF
VRVVHRGRFALALVVPICATACSAHRRPDVHADRRTQVIGSTVEARDPTLAAVLLQLRLTPTAAQHRAVAEQYRRLGILDTAFDHLTAATRIDPRDAAAYDARARIWRDWGYPGLGMSDAARAIYFAPQSAAAHNTYGTLLVAAGLPAQAKREFLAALGLDPGADFARTNLCRLESLGSEPDRAETRCPGPALSTGQSR